MSHSDSYQILLLLLQVLSLLPTFLQLLPHPHTQSEILYALVSEIVKRKDPYSSSLLEGLNIIDVGCGGGFHLEAVDWKKVNHISRVLIVVFFRGKNLEISGGVLHQLEDVIPELDVANSNDDRAALGEEAGVGPNSTSDSK